MADFVSRLDAGVSIWKGLTYLYMLDAATHRQSRTGRALRDPKLRPIIVWLVVTKAQEWKNTAKVTKGMAEPGPE